MQPDSSDLQDRLLRYYSDQLSRYETLDAEVQQLRTSSDQSGEVLSNVRRILQHISDRDGEHTALRQQWLAANESASPELKNTVRKVTDLIEKVMAHVSQTETHTRNAQEELRPLISNEATRRKVADAYGTR